ncbi:MAG TPA: trehalase family glycosidase [Terriglobales bacterium]|nr:trehalase family glycosidase [Terriglobales bacterium]
MNGLLERAQQVLDANWTGEATVASRSLYPHQWSWDAAFVAIGRSWAEPARAMRELESMFQAQWANGMLPHIRFDPRTRDYFPGPDFWASDRVPLAPAGLLTSGLTQPPLHARAALEVFRHGGGDAEAVAFLRRLFPRLVAQHGYLEARRDPAGHGLAAIVHPWESGLDNSPIWDAELDAIEVPPGSIPPYRRSDLVRANAADRPSAATYDRYVYLAVRYRDSGYDDADLLASSPFLVEDVLFNTVYLWSATALVEIAGILGEPRGPLEAAARRIHDGLLAHLWDPDASRFFSYDLRASRSIRKESVDSAIPLLDQGLPGDLVEAICAELMSTHFEAPATVSHYVVPSYDLSGADFDRRRYWRGPVWINTNWMLWRGLRQHGRDEMARQVEESTVRLVERSGFREYFDPFTGEGYGSMDFSWTAALLIDVLRNRADPPRL